MRNIVKHQIRELNQFIEVYRAKVSRIHRQLEIDGREITARAIKDILQGKEDPEKPKTLVNLFTEHNKQVHSLVGKDIVITNIDNQIVRNYDLFLKTQCGCHHNSALKHLKNLKKIVRIAMANGWVQKDPFLGIKFIEQETHVEFLTKEELSTLINIKFKIPQHNQVRDIFVKEDNDGYLWIRKPRQKTGVMCNIPLIPQAIKLMEKYKDHPHCIINKVVMPVFSNICMNDYLRDIAKLCNFNKPLTCHVARHSFSTSIMLDHGVSMETLSKVLGHSNIKTTQIYAKVTNKKVSYEMNMLSKKIRNI